MSAVASIFRVSQKRLPVKEVRPMNAQVVPLVRGQRVNPELVKEIYDATLVAINKQPRQKIWISQYSVGALGVWVRSNAIAPRLEKELSPKQLKMAVHAATKRLHRELDSGSSDPGVRVMRLTGNRGGTTIKLLKAGEDYLARERSLAAHPASGAIKIGVIR
jgi:hypothetical protein